MQYTVTLKVGFYHSNVYHCRDVVLRTVDVHHRSTNFHRFICHVRHMVDGHLLNDGLHTSADHRYNIDQGSVLQICHTYHHIGRHRPTYLDLAPYTGCEIILLFRDCHCFHLDRRRTLLVFPATDFRQSNPLPGVRWGVAPRMTVNCVPEVWI